MPIATTVLSEGARFGLAAVLATAGLAKLRHRDAGPAAVRALGVPARPARLAGRVLPVVELVVAGALVAGGAPWGAYGAIGLVVLFDVALGIGLVRGDPRGCRCFGRPAPIGWRTLTRNALMSLAALAVLSSVH